MEQKCDIAIVDNNKRPRENLRDYLEKRGHLAVTLDFEEALEELPKKFYPVVVMETFQWDFLQLVRKVRSSFPPMPEPSYASQGQKYCRSEFIVLTGHPSVDSAVEGLKNDFFAYVIKPADLQDISGTVDSALLRAKNPCRNKKDS